MVDPAHNRQHDSKSPTLPIVCGVELDIHFKTAREVLGVGHRPLLENSVELRLVRDGAVVDVLPVWPPPVHKGGVDIHFDSMLLTSVDKIRKGNRMERLSFDSVSVSGQADLSSVMAQVAQAVATALKSR